jgi:N-ethylmaleimide reductase
MLLEPTTLGPLSLQNRVVLAPLTRSRAVEDNTANALMAEYYGQRATAGLLITEGTSPSPNGLGYGRIPGLFREQDVAGWKLSTDAAHAKGARIFVQLMHTGRVGHPLNLPKGAELLGPSDLAAPGEMWTDAQGNQPHPAPRAMTEAEIQSTIGEYVHSAQLAVKAGFDGIELHGANGYLIEQFLNANVNTRTDAWGGSPEKRNHFALEVAKAVVAAVGKDKVGIRLSPYGVFNGTGAFEGVDAQYEALASELGKLGLVYIHLVDHEAMGAPPVPAALKAAITKAFGGTIILSGGYDKARAEADLQAKKGNLVAFGRPFLANPDLVARLAGDKPLNAPKPDTFYTPGPVGYTDYPFLDSLEPPLRVTPSRPPPHAGRRSARFVGPRPRGGGRGLSS